MGRFFSVSSGPPGTAFIMKNVRVATRNRTGIVSRTRRPMNCSMRRSASASAGLRGGALERRHRLALGREPDVRIGVVVENRRMPSAHARLDEEHARVVVDGND